MRTYTFKRLRNQEWPVGLVFLLACAASLPAQVILEPRIVSETLPSGSLMQIKVELTSPHPIVTGNARLEMDSSFDGIEGVSAFSPAGDAYGVAYLRGQTFISNLVSSLESLGTQANYPFLVVASPIRAGIPNGTVIPLTFAPGNIFNAPGGTPYAYIVRNGTLTIGGSLSVTNVIPGGGILPAGTTVRVLGTGFTNLTQLDPGTLLINNLRTISATELRFEMGQTAAVSGQRFRVKNPQNNIEAVYYPYLRATQIGASSRTLLNDSHPIFQQATPFTSAALTLPGTPSPGFIGVALQNGSFDQTAAVQVQLISAAGGLLGGTSISMPPATRWARTVAELFNTTPPAGAKVRITSSIAVHVLGLNGDETAGNVAAFLAAAVAPPGNSTMTANPPSVLVDYQIGAAVPSNRTISLTSSAGAVPFLASSNVSWMSVTSSGGQTPATLTVSFNPAGLAVGIYDGAVTVDEAGAVAKTIPVSITVTPNPGGGGAGTQTGLRFVPITPCRIADTRTAAGPFGAPALAAGATRVFALPQSGCGIPGGVLAYSLNVTVVPSGPLGYITIWPAGAAQPFVSTLNSIDGRVKANAALVPAGTNGSVNVFATGPTELILDINGYFVDPASTPASYAFYPLIPCRVADTRNAAGPLGGPVLAAGVPRTIQIVAANCGVPANAAAYSLNATVVPPGPLGFLTLWPTGQPQPFVSTLNAPTGAIVANAAIVPSGTNGSINAFGSGETHLVLDINGYFAQVGAANAQRFFTATPCRLLDTRLAPGEFGGPILTVSQTRNYRLPLATCGLPSTATAFSLNATVVPTTTLGYLTLWPAGTAQPFVSTLNAPDDPIVANAAIVPAGTQGGVSSFTPNGTHLILDTNGYFAP